MTKAEIVIAFGEPVRPNQVTPLRLLDRLRPDSNPGSLRRHAAMREAGERDGHGADAVRLMGCAEMYSQIPSAGLVSIGSQHLSPAIENGVHAFAR